jgi:hypothetical protein
MSGGPLLNPGDFARVTRYDWVPVQRLVSVTDRRSTEDGVLGEVIAIMDNSEKPALVPGTKVYLSTFLECDDWEQVTLEELTDEEATELMKWHLTQKV